MESNNQTVLKVSKQRIHELEDVLLTYKIMCTQQQIEIENYNKIIAELSKKLAEFEPTEETKNVPCKESKNK